MEQRETNLMDTIVSLAKRRGFIFPGSEIYGGLAGTWDYGPLGVELKNNIKQLWWKRFVQERKDVVGIDSAIIMNSGVWDASGHIKEFVDPLVECSACKNRWRVDALDQIGARNSDGSYQCPTMIASSIKGGENIHCPGKLSDPRQFNLLFRTFVGPIEDSANQTYLRPETAQGMFVNFKNVLDTMHQKLPFGIAQIGKAFRNEITPRDFIFRSREFEQMEIEYFVREGDWEQQFEHWRAEMQQWIKDIGIDMSRVHELDVPEDERAHYSKRTIDFMYDFPFGRKELYGLAYRTDFDLKNHFKEPPYREEGMEAFYPHVIEPTWGVDRNVLAVLLSSYAEENDRRLLKLPPCLAPYRGAVFPLLANKPALVEKAREVYRMLTPSMMVAWDERGNIGKRYYAQDEIGTPFCMTIDFTTLEDDTVTVRERDTAQQTRVKINELAAYITDNTKL